MISRVSLYVASRFCDWRARAALQAYGRWRRRAEKFFQKIGSGL